MTWENILKNFKGSKIDFKTMQKNNKNYADFLEYRIGRVKSSIDKYDENKEEYNSDPNSKQYRKSIKQEYDFLMDFVPKYLDMLNELEDAEMIIQETVNAENRVD